MDNPQKLEYLLIQRLSVFVGSFSLDAAKAVISPSEIEEEKLTDLLDHLVSLGKMKTEGQSDHQRYQLSEEQREMVRKLRSANDIENQVYSHLVDYYLRLSEQSLEEAFGPQRAMWIDRLEQEHLNLQAVFQWLIERSDAERGLRLAFLLQELWFEHHHTSEARTLFATLLALPTASAQTRSRAQYLDLAGAFALAQNDYDTARALKQEGLAICRTLEDRDALGSSLLHLGHVERFAGDYSAAHQLYQESLTIFRELDNPRWIAHATANLGSATLDLGDYSDAGKLVEESLQLYRDMNFEWEMALAIGNAAGVAAGLGQPEQAIQLAGASKTHRQRIGVSHSPAFEERFERIIGSARQTLPESNQTTLWEAGTAMSLTQAVEYALRILPNSN